MSLATDFRRPRTLNAVTQIPETPRPAYVQAVPAAPEARGFVLYVGLDEAKANLDGTTLTELVEALKRVTAEVAPHAETHAAVALAPKGAGGRDVEVVRLALQDPQALAARGVEEDDQPDSAEGVTIDTTRKRVSVSGENAGLTYKEFELLKYLAHHPGRVFTRAQLLQEVWGYDYFGGTRTVDVHVGRLRAKLGSDHETLIGTVRNVGYRFVPDEVEAHAGA